MVVSQYIPNKHIETNVLLIQNLKSVVVINCQHSYNLLFDSLSVKQFRGNAYVLKIQFFNMISITSSGVMKFHYLLHELSISL